MAPTSTQTRPFLAAFSVDLTDHRGTDGTPPAPGPHPKTTQPMEDTMKALLSTAGALALIATSAAAQ
ncbi:hypothetical protein, partial [Rhodosalinus sp.]|uniref:hypothetical protein n=1 Tax=Rhodosalinus sp. TaxID=2047741 RepID=UPI0035687D8F